MKAGRIYIPGPKKFGGAFEVRDELTIYEAAMVYSGRHPGGSFVGGAGGYPRADLDDYELYLGRGAEDGARKLAWDVYCQLREAVASRKIIPKRPAFNPSGRIDPRDTVIATDDVARLARERGDEPIYLAKWRVSEHSSQAQIPKQRRRKPKVEMAKKLIAQRYPKVPTKEEVTPGILYRDCMRGITDEISPESFERARTELLKERNRNGS